MYARSNAIRGNPSKMDDGIAYTRDTVMPAVQQMDGCVGLSMLCDRGDGRCIVTTAWADHEAMMNSREGVKSIRERAAEVFEGRPEVNEWEIAILHRMHETPEGGCARIAWSAGDAGDLDRMVEDFKTRAMPRLEQMDGFCSLSMLIDRETGRGVLATSYENRAALDATSGEVQAMRDEFMLRMNRQVTEIAVMDVVLAHLRVPETA
jgi:heme-degrading monooxygenase HmoA